MKRLLLLLLLLPALLCAQLQATKVIIKLSNGKEIPAIKYTPATVQSNAPLWIFCAGKGEQYTTDVKSQADIDKAYTNLLNSGNHASLVKYSAQYGFQILAPLFVQAYNNWAPDFQGGWYIRDVANWAKANMNIDPDRIIVVGLSSGGNAVWDAGVRLAETAQLFAGLVPLCGGGINNSQGAVHWDYPAKYNIPVWAFHAKDDASSAPAVYSINQVDSVNAYKPAVKAKLTLYPSGGHSAAWTNAFSDTSLYKWALTLKRTSTPKPPDPEIPTKTIVAKLEITLYSDGTTETKKLQ